MHVLTANRLTDGRVVYLNGTGDWVTDLAQARAADEDDVARAGARAVAERLVVDPYLVELSETAEPARYREAIRATGPSIAYRGTI